MVRSLPTDAIDDDPALSGFDKTKEAQGESGFATTSRTDYANFFARLNLKGDAVQNIGQVGLQRVSVAHDIDRQVMD